MAVCLISHCRILEAPAWQVHNQATGYYELFVYKFKGEPGAYGWKVLVQILHPRIEKLDESRAEVGERMMSRAIGLGEELFDSCVGSRIRGRLPIRAGGLRFVLGVRWDAACYRKSSEALTSSDPQSN